VQTLLAIVALACLPGEVRAQGPAPTQPGTIRLLIDCLNTSCDHDFFRTNLTFIDHVRERQDADVHLLITSEPAGVGGREITFSFLGQGRFAGRDHVLRQTVIVAASDDQVRREMVRVISLGLVPYLLDSPALERLTIATLTRVASPAQVGFDPWHRWTFRTQVNGTGSGELSTGFWSLSGSFNVNRTTAAMKLNLSVSGSYNESRFDLPDGSEFVSPTRRSDAGGLFAWSLGPHWSAGGRASLSSSTFRNINRSWYVAPAIEYDVFPYSESTRRLLTLHYSVGVRDFDYEEETIYGKLEERTAAQSLTASLTLRQPWGTVGTGVDASSFLPAIEFYRTTAWGDFDLNLFRGFSLNLNAQLSSVHDQVSLPRGEATTEEILVRQRELATSYSYFYSFGISYTFGSIYSPVVNLGSDAGILGAPLGLEISGPTRWEWRTCQRLALVGHRNPRCTVVLDLREDAVLRLRGTLGAYRRDPSISCPFDDARLVCARVEGQRLTLDQAQGPGSVGKCSEAVKWSGAEPGRFRPPLFAGPMAHRVSALAGGCAMNSKTDADVAVAKLMIELLAPTPSIILRVKPDRRRIRADRPPELERRAAAGPSSLLSRRAPLLCKRRRRRAASAAPPLPPSPWR
jgi:hypothetical protein